MKLLTTLALFLTLISTVSTAKSGLHFGNSEAGTVLLNTNGMVVYTYDEDPAGRSICLSGCAAKWPPVLATSNANSYGEFSIITRPDSTRQWAYEGNPLYQWVMDLDVGQATGNNVGNQWHVVKP